MSTTHFGTAYVRYNVKLPNRTLLKILIWLGAALIVSGIVVSFIAFNPWLTNAWAYNDYTVVCNQDSCYYDYADKSRPFKLEIYHGVIILIAGILLATVAWKRYSHFYRIVRCGRVVERETGGGGLSGLGWYITIEGNTYANERRRYSFPVNAGDWHDTRHNQVVYL